MSEKTYYAWRSDLRDVVTIKAESLKQAAHNYALRDQIPYHVALRIVEVQDVASFMFEVK